MTDSESVMQPLTDKQQQVLDFIISHTDDYGCPPTLRAIGVHTKTSGTSTALMHVQALERKGYISRRVGNSRNISLIGRPGSVSVPCVGRVRAGLPMPAIEDFQGHFRVDASWVNGDNCFFLVIEGDSMIDAGIYEGDLALIRPQQNAENGQIVVAMINGDATLKRFYREEDHIRLQPENATIAPIIIRDGDADTVIIGKLIKTIRTYP
jgi:repressor LexA